MCATRLVPSDRKKECILYRECRGEGLRRERVIHVVRFEFVENALDLGLFQFHGERITGQVEWYGYATISRWCLLPSKKIKLTIIVLFVSCYFVFVLNCNRF